MPSPNPIPKGVGLYCFRSPVHLSPDSLSRRQAARENMLQRGIGRATPAGVVSAMPKRGSVFFDRSRTMGDPSRQLVRRLTRLDGLELQAEFAGRRLSRGYAVLGRAFIGMVAFRQRDSDEGRFTGLENSGVDRRRVKA